MAILDNESLIQTFDTENMLQSIQDLPDQLEVAWQHMKDFVFPTHYIQARSVVILGVGASYIAGVLAKSPGFEARVPIDVVGSGSLPAYVDTNTLVIAVSYSGKTPETSESFREAGTRGAKLFGISTGGDVAALCRKYRAPHFAIQYGSQPRAAFGYLAIPVMMALTKLNIVEIDKFDESVRHSISALRVSHDRLSPNLPTNQNLAKQLATTLFESVPYIIGSQAVWSPVLRWQSQLQQSAHMFVVVDTVSNLTHSAIEGLGVPVEITERISIVLLRSVYETPDMAAMVTSLERVLRKRGLPVESVALGAASDRFAESIELIHLGDYVSFYLALLHGVDPSATPNIMEVQAVRESALETA